MPDLARVQTTFSGVTGSPYFSGMYFDATEIAVQAVVDSVADFWDALAGYMLPEMTWVTGARVLRISDATGEASGVLAATSRDGKGTAAGTAEALPPANQVKVRWLTGEFISGRELAGATFIPGLVDTVNADGLVLAAFRTALAAAAQELLIETAAAGGQMRVFSPTHGTSADVVTVESRNYFAVLRSRRD